MTIEAQSTQLVITISFLASQSGIIVFNYYNPALNHCE